MQHENTVDKGDFQTVKARSCFIYSMSDEKENAPNTSVELFSVSWMKCIKVGCEGVLFKKGGKNLFSSFSNLSAKDVRSEGSRKNWEKRRAVKAIFTPEFCQTDKQDPQRCVSLLSFSLGRRKKGRNNRLLTTSNLFSNCRFFFFAFTPGEKC